MMIQTPDGAPFECGPSTLVGRGVVDGLNITDPSVSGLHAVIAWHRGKRCWMIYDLQSSNGTFVTPDGMPDAERARLVSGRGERLRPDDRLTFGERTCLVLDCDPPPARATCVATGDVRTATDGVLVLPDEQRAEVYVVHTRHGWVIRQSEPAAAAFEAGTAGETLPAEQPVTETDAEEITLSVGDAVWSVWLPSEVPTTRPQQRVEAPPRRFRCEIEVKQAGDIIRLVLLDGTRRIELAPRRHHEMVWLLALAREEDAELPEDERGWRDGHQVLAQLGRRSSDGNYIGVLKHRLTDQIGKRLAHLKLPDCEPLIERDSGRVRLAPVEFRIVDPRRDEDAR